MGLLLFFSASLSPRSSVMSTVKQRCKLGPWEKKKKKKGGEKKIQRGNNCDYDFCACHSRAPIVSVSIEVCPYEEG